MYLLVPQITNHTSNAPGVCSKEIADLWGYMMYIYIYKPGTQITLVLNGVWAFFQTFKIEDIHRFQVINETFTKYATQARRHQLFPPMFSRHIYIYIIYIYTLIPPSRPWTRNFPVFYWKIIPLHLDQHVTWLQKISFCSSRSRSSDPKVVRIPGFKGMWKFSFGRTFWGLPCANMVI